MSVIILCAYAFIGFVHEVSALCFWEKVRKFTKAALMPVLLVYYITIASDLLVAAVIAITFSWLGDILPCLRKEAEVF